MRRWTAFTRPDKFNFDGKSVKRLWARLHACDREPLPESTALLDAWALYHNGAFEAALQAATALGDAGHTLANKTTCAYAAYLEPDETLRLTLYQQVIERASEQIESSPENANAHYLQAFALGRYSQGISVTRGLSQGLGSRTKHALEAAIRLQPQHAEAYIALGSFHAEVIDKLGVLIASMTYGAKRERSLQMFEQGMGLLPRSPLAMIEYATALIMLDGEQRRDEARMLYAQAAALPPLDALDWLTIEEARAGLPPEPDPVTGAAPL